MQLQELMNRLVEITARPDKKVLMEQAINKACQRIGIMHYFLYQPSRTCSSPSIRLLRLSIHSGYS